MATIALPRAMRPANPMVGKELVFKRNNVATTGADEPCDGLQLVCREELRVSGSLVLRTKRQLAVDAPEGRSYDRQGNLGRKHERFELPHFRVRIVRDFCLTWMDNQDSKTRADDARVALVTLFISSCEILIVARTDEETRGAQQEKNRTSQRKNPYLPHWVFHTRYTTQTAFVFESGKNSFIRDC